MVGGGSSWQLVSIRKILSIAEAVIINDVRYDSPACEWWGDELGVNKQMTMMESAFDR